MWTARARRDACTAVKAAASPGQPEPGSWKLKTHAHKRRHAPDGRVDRRGNHRPLDQEGRRRGRPRRAAVRDLDRQGRRRDPVACGRRADRDQGEGRRDRPGQQRRRGHRRRARAAARRRPAAEADRQPEPQPAAADRRGPGEAAGGRGRRTGGHASDTHAIRRRAERETCAARSRRRWCAASRRSTTSTSGAIHGSGIAGRVTKQDILDYIEASALPPRRRPATARGARGAWRHVQAGRARQRRADDA